jgi:hypothetical protein
MPTKAISHKKYRVHSPASADPSASPLASLVFGVRKFAPWWLTSIPVSTSRGRSGPLKATVVGSA